MDTQTPDAVRMLGGPYDGESIDVREVFGDRLPAGLAIGCGGRTAYYELDIDAAGECYRFSGCRTERMTDGPA